MNFAPAPFIDRAACRGLDPELFYPHRGENRIAVEAKAICAGCSVQDECLEWALGNRETIGIWGGTSDLERRVVRRQRRLVVAHGHGRTGAMSGRKG